MRRFTVFRARILSVLAAAGVAQAGCGGTVRTGAAGADGVDGGVDPSPGNPPGCASPLDLETQLNALASTCGLGSPSCSRSDSTECFALAVLAGGVRECAAPIRAGACPPVADLARTGSCSFPLGNGSFNGTECCYPSRRLSCAVPGRALRVQGVVLLPEVVVGAPLAEVEELGIDATAQRALAELWCEGARYEYASVASFARGALHLMALGAPAELVAASQAASLDEVEHARLCFALASRFSRRELRAGRLVIDESFGKIELAELAVENVLGGCVGETVAALTAAAQLDVATDPEVRAALTKIAEDETRHAELAWRIAAWAAEVGGDAIREQMAAAFRDALEPRSTNAVADASGERALVGLGQLGAVHERAIRDRILSDVVGPCARALLAA